MFTDIYFSIQVVQNKPPLLKVFIARVRLVYFIEFHIATERDKLATHYQSKAPMSQLVNEMA